MKRKRFFELVMAALMLMLTYAAAVRAAGLKTGASAGVAGVNGRVVAIDPGHGGIDGGAVSVDGTPEKEINLDISLKLRDLLEEAGVTVVMTRETDDGLYSESDSNKKVADMRARCEIVNGASPDLMVSVHQNNYSLESVKGAQVFYYSQSAGGERLAKLLQESLVAELDPDNGRQAKSNDNYYMLKNVKCTAVIAECGFLSNYGEAALLADETYRQKVAEALFKGICSYLEEK